MVFPFCLAMVRKFGISLEWEGICAGALAASYSAGQSLSGKLWGKLSDRVGRKPTILSGLGAASICMLCFGLSTTYMAAFFSRLCGGIFNGFTGILKALVTEHTDEGDERSKLFLVLQIGSSIGAIAGPLLGGLLVGNENGWHPYLLPCGACSLLQIAACVLGGYALPSEHKENDQSGQDRHVAMAVTNSVHRDCALRFVDPISCKTKILRDEWEESFDERNVDDSTTCSGHLHLLQPECTTVGGSTLDDISASVLGARLRAELRHSKHIEKQEAVSHQKLSDIFSLGTAEAANEATTLRQHVESDKEVGNLYGAISPPTLSAPHSSKASLWNTPRYALASSINAFSALLDELTSVSTALLLGWPLIDGGGGMDSASLGMALGIAGLGMLTIVMIGLPPLQRMYGPIFLYRFANLSLASVTVSLPLACKFGLYSHHLLPFLVVPLMAFSNGSCAASLVCSNIFVQKAIEDPSRLGEGNGQAQVLISVGRIIGPTLAGVIFSFGEGVGDIAAGFVLIAFLCVVACVASTLLSGIDRARGRGSNVPSSAERGKVEIEAKHHSSKYFAQDKSTASTAV